MAVICHTVDAEDLPTYTRQLAVAARLSERIHIDLMDGEFAPNRSPDLTALTWPAHTEVDVHLMHQRPMEVLDWLVRAAPRMVILQAESHVHHMHMAAELHKHGILTGLCILQETPVDNIKQIMHSFDHVLVFSGNLGYQGGTADLALVDKVRAVRDYYHEVSIGWDGGVNDANAARLLEAGVDVLNVGGFIQKADDPEHAYATLKAVVDRYV